MKSHYYTKLKIYERSVPWTMDIIHRLIYISLLALNFQNSNLLYSIALIHRVDNNRFTVSDNNESTTVFNYDKTIVVDNYKSNVFEHNKFTVFTSNKLTEDSLTINLLYSLTITTVFDNNNSRVTCV